MCYFSPHEDGSIMVLWLHLKLKRSVHKKSLSTKIHALYSLALDILTEGQLLERAQMYLAADLCEVWGVFSPSASVLFLGIGPQMEQLGNIFGSGHGKWVSKPSG